MKLAIGQLAFERHIIKCSSCKVDYESVELPKNGKLRSYLQCPICLSKIPVILHHKKPRYSRREGRGFFVRKAGLTPA